MLRRGATVITKHTNLVDYVNGSEPWQLHAPHKLLLAFINFNIAKPAPKLWGVTWCKGNGPATYCVHSHPQLFCGFVQIPRHAGLMTTCKHVTFPTPINVATAQLTEMEGGTVVHQPSRKTTFSVDHTRHSKHHRS